MDALLILCHFVAERTRQTDAPAQAGQSSAATSCGAIGRELGRTVTIGSRRWRGHVAIVDRVDISHVTAGSLRPELLASFSSVFLSLLQQSFSHSPLVTVLLGL